MNEDYSYLYDHKMRMAELQDIAAMDRMAAELRPQSALSRWVQQRTDRRRQTSGSRGFRRLLGHQARHAA